MSLLINLIKQILYLENIIYEELFMELQELDKYLVITMNLYCNSTKNKKGIVIFIYISKDLGLKSGRLYIIWIEKTSK